MTSLASALNIELQLGSRRTTLIVRSINFYSNSMEIRILFLLFVEEEKKTKRKIIACNVLVIAR